MMNQFDVARITKIWHRDKKWANIEKNGLFKAGLPHTFNLQKCNIFKAQ